MCHWHSSLQVLFCVFLPWVWLAFQSSSLSVDGIPVCLGLFPIHRKSTAKVYVFKYIEEYMYKTCIHYATNVSEGVWSCSDLGSETGGAMIWFELWFFCSAAVQSFLVHCSEVCHRHFPWLCKVLWRCRSWYIFTGSDLLILNVCSERGCILRLYSQS